MTRIAVGQDVVTLINVFTVAPENQQRLVDRLVAVPCHTSDRLCITPSIRPFRRRVADSTVEFSGSRFRNAA